jgi:hypothetical protein
MDLHNVIVAATEEVIYGVAKAKAELTGKAKVDFPTSIEFEFGMTSAYEVANYDDVRVATVRVRVPIFGEAAPITSPASDALAEEEKPGDKKKTKPEKGKK